VVAAAAAVADNVIGGVDGALLGEAGAAALLGEQGLGAGGAVDAGVGVEGLGQGG